MEDTLVIIKPDAVKKGLVGEIIGRFEKSGFEIVQADAGVLGEYDLERLYKEHKGKPFYAGNLEFMQSGMAIALWLRGRKAVGAARFMAGATNPADANPGTIRGDFAKSGPGVSSKLPRNCVHASDSPESADRELRIFFDDYSL